MKSKIIILWVGLFFCATITFSTEIISLTRWEEGNGGNGHWYAIIAEELTYDEANSAAQSTLREGLFGHLATITSQEENDFIFQITLGTNPPSPNYQFRLGGFYTSGDWIWISEEDFNYTNWAPGEPNNDLETTITMWAPTNSDQDRLSKWNDCPPSVPFWSIVEWDTEGVCPYAGNINLGSEDWLHVTDHTPIFYWTYIDTMGIQTQYEIEVGIDADWTVVEMWSTGEVISPDTQATYAGIGLEDGDKYYLRIRLSNGISWGSWTTFIFRMNSIPSVPIALRPITGDVVSIHDVRLFVTNSNDQESDLLSYDFEVYADPALQTLVGSVSSIIEQADSTGTEPFPDFSINTEYWWRVRSYDGFEYSEWSGLDYFITRPPTAIHVPGDQPTIQAGIDSASPEDTVLVAPGTYIENINFHGKHVKLIGAEGAENTILHPASGHVPVISLVSQENEGVQIAGFTISGSTGEMAVEIVNAINPTIDHCVFADNGASGSNFLVIRVHSNATIKYNRFYTNQGSACIGLYYGGSALIINNTFDNNKRGLISTTGKGIVKNNIFSSSSMDGIYGFFEEIDYNCLWNNNPDYAGGAFAGNHDLSLDPLFVDPATHDYSLKSISPCIDAGDPDPQYYDPDGTRNDMGAIPHFSGEYPIPAYFNLGPDDIFHVINHTPTFYWSYLEAKVYQEAYEIEVGDDTDWSSAEMWVTGQVVSSDTFAVYAGAPLVDGTTYFVRMRVNDGVTWGSWLEHQFRLNTPPPVPAPLHPIAGENSNSFLTRLSVVNAEDPESDQLVYDFEIYADPSLSNLLVYNYNVPEQTSSTSSDPFPDIELDNTYWWRVRAFDGFEYSEWSGAESFFANGGNVIRVPDQAPTILNAINSAQNGDKILVSPGTYTENILIYPAGDLIITSSDGAESTFIEPDRVNYYTLRFGDEAGLAIIFRGFTVVGDEFSYAVDIRKSSRPYIEYCRFGKHHGKSFIHVYSNAKPVIRYNLFYANRSDNCVDICGDADAKIINNTFDHNDGAIYSENGCGTIKNNIITNSRVHGISGAFTEIDYNNLWNNGTDYADEAQPGPNDISSDPLYRDCWLYDYGILVNSPCINAGDPDSDFSDPDGSRNDMGAFWFNADYPIAANINFGQQSTGSKVFTLTPEFFWSYLDEVPTTQTQYEIEIGTDDNWMVAEMWVSGSVASTDTSAIYAGTPLTVNNIYFVRIRVRNGTEWGSWQQQAFVILLSDVVYVPIDYFSIQEAIDASSNGEEILVAPGVYRENLRFDQKGVQVISTHGPQVTHLQPAVTAYSSIWFHNINYPAPQLSGFFVHGSGEQKLIYSISSSPVINNNIFTGYKGVEYDALFYGSKALIKNNTFINNQGAKCITIYDGSCKIINNTFYNNAGGIYAGSNDTLYNNIIAHCSTFALSCAGVNDYNCLWNNDCDYTDNTSPGGHDIYDDPHFSDPTGFDFSLLPYSPCVDAGNPAAQYNDIDGSTCDIGAILHQHTIPLASNINLGDENDLRVTNHTPIFYWSYHDTVGPQTALDAEVGTDYDWSVAEMWSSGEIQTSDTSLQYSGSTLQDGQKYYVRIRVSNGQSWGDWITKWYKMNTDPAPPDPIWPRSMDTVFYATVFMQVANSTDAESDTLAYDFEIYRDAELTDLMEAQYDILEQENTTRSQVVADLEPDMQYWWRARAYDGYDHSGWSPSRTFFTRSGGGVIHVPADMATIQDGIDIAGDWDTVLVGPGVYEENLFIDKNIRLLGSGASATVLKPASSDQLVVHIINGIPEYTVFGGFTIATDKAHFTDQIINMDGATVRNCTFRNFDNTGSLNFIITADINSKVTYCLFYKNEVCCIGSVGSIVINNTINASRVGIYGSGIIKNNIVTNCYIGVWGESFELDYNLIHHNTYADYHGSAIPGPHDLSLDPQYVDAPDNDYTLKIKSPCINAGDPNPAYNDVDGTRNDIGAFPHIYEPPAALRVNLGSEDDNHVVSHTPAFYWTFYDTVPGYQTAYEIEVGTDNDWVVAEMWLSGEIASSDNTTVYAGLPLEDGVVYFVRVRLYNGLRKGGWEAYWFRMNSNPIPPMPISPVDVIEQSPYNLQLLASGAYDVDGDQLTYDFEIFADSGLSRLADRDYGIPERQGSTISKHFNDLEPMTIYWWRVRAHDGFEYSDWSERPCFVTAHVDSLLVPQEYATIQEAINAAANGNIIKVSCGEYSENIDFGGKNVRVEGAGFENTLIMPVNPNLPAIKFVSAENSYARLKGFAFTEDGGNQFIEIGNDASPKISNCAFYNFGQKGNGTAVITAGSNATIKRCLFYDNGGRCCIEIRDSASVLVLNNTFNHNSGGILAPSGGGIVLNNIITRSTGFGIKGDISEVDFNNVWNNNPNYDGVTLIGDFNISENPTFFNLFSHDYNLKPGSPCINAGDPDPLFNDPDGSRNDMGALPFGGEYGYPLAVGINLGEMDMFHITNHQPMICWSFLDPIQTQHAFELKVGTGYYWNEADMWATGVVNSSDTCVAYGGLPLEDGHTYLIKIRVNNGVTWGSWVHKKFRMNSAASAPEPKRPINGGTANAGNVLLYIRNSSDAENDRLTYEFDIYDDYSLSRLLYKESNVVEQDYVTVSSRITVLDNAREYWWHARAHDGHEYSDWSETASFNTASGAIVYVPEEQPTIQAGIEFALDGDTVFVNRGTYIENINFLGKSIKVISKKSLETILLPADMSKPVVSFTSGEDEYCQLSGFIITGSGFSGYEFIIADSASNPTITGNVFRNCTGSNPNLAVIDVFSRATITHNLFYGNNDGEGCVRLNYHHGWNTNIVNNTFFNNVAAIVDVFGGCYVKNNIIANSTYGLVGRFIDADYNDFWSNDYDYYDNATPGEHDIYSDPMFVDPVAHNFWLQDSSPCIDAGDPTYPPPLWGGDVIDIGAYEYVYLKPGDANGDDTVDVGDIVFLINYIFKAGQAPNPGAVGDANGDCMVNIADAVYLVNYVFHAGPEPRNGCADKSSGYSK